MNNKYDYLKIKTLLEIKALLELQNGLINKEQYQAKLEGIEIDLKEDYFSDLMD